MKRGTVKVEAPISSHALKTLDEWSKDFGAPDAEVVEELYTTIESSELRDLGRHADSAVLIEETPGFLASVVEIERGLTPKQRAVLVGYTPMWLPVLANETIELRGVYGRFVKQDAAAMRELAKRRAAANDAWSECVAIRDQGVLNLRRAAGSRGEIRALVDGSAGNARSVVSLTTGTNAVAETLAALLAETDAAKKPTPLARVLRRTMLDEGFVAALKTAADLVTTTDDAANATAANLVTQDQLDTQDGRVMRVTEWIWRAFRQANKRDPSIGVPSLGKMESLFVPKRSAKEPEEGDPATPARPETPETTATPAKPVKPPVG